MTLDALEASLTAPAPPRGLPPLVEALWHERHGDWTRAHQIAQDVEDADGAWVHAYLHRKEGDLSNAGYWYRRAKRPVATGPPDAEWERIAESLLGRP